MQQVPVPVLALERKVCLCFLSFDVASFSKYSNQILGIDIDDWKSFFIVLLRIVRLMSVMSFSGQEKRRMCLCLCLRK